MKRNGRILPSHVIDEDKQDIRLLLHLRSGTDLPRHASYQKECGKRSPLIDSPSVHEGYLFILYR
jgi:hypothetical protein